MNVRAIWGALIIGASVAIAAPGTPSLAQSNNPSVSAPGSAMARATPWKHRYWRHRGGRHPHYGSRRVRQ